MEKGNFARMAFMAVFIAVIALCGAAGKAHAAVAALDPWALRLAAAPAAISYTGTSAAFTVSAGTNRLLVAGFCLETAAATTMTTAQMRLDGAAGTVFIPFNSTTLSQRSHCYMGYLTGSQVTAGSHTVYVNAALAASTITSIDVMSAQYQGVNQTTPNPAGSCIANSSGAVTVTFGGTVNYFAGGMSIYITENGGTPATITHVSGFATNTSTTANAQSVFAAQATNATAGTYVSASTVTYAGTTSARSAIVAAALNPAPTDLTPPTAGTVTVTPDGNGFTSSAPTITTAFTDNESALLSCLYTTNGSAWAAGSVSGTLPNFICSASPTGLSGALTLNMSAISSGGTATATSISRTVDTTAPTNGTLTATTGDAQLTLNWSGITDAGIGLAPTGTYVIRWVQNATPPANCTANNLLGTFDVGTTTTNHTGLTNGLVYSYRICSSDLAGVQNLGATASGTPNVVSHEDLGQSGNTAIATTASDSQTGVVMQRFQVTSATGTPPGTPQDNQVTLTSIGLNDIGTASFIADAQVYIDTTLSATLPGTAVLIGSTGGWNGTATTVTLSLGGTARNVANGSPKYIYIVYNMQSGQAGLSVQSQVTSLGVTAPDNGLPVLTLNSNIITLSLGPKYTVSCGDCHATPPVDAPTTRDTPTGAVIGDHYKHAAPTQYNYACVTCHTSAASSYSTDHRNSLIEMQTTSIQGGAYGKGISFNQTNDLTGAGLNKCNNTYCHSGGTGGTLNAGDTRGIASNSSPTWGIGGAVNCGSCHGRGGDGSGQPNYTNWTTKANSHAAHIPWNTTKSCNVCHYGTTQTGTTVTNMTNHNDKTYDLVNYDGPTRAWASVFEFSYTYNVSGGTCATSNCHGEQSPRWGTPGSSATGDWDCIGCHSYSFKKRLGGGIGTIRKVAGTGGDFDKAYRHLRGATTIVKWDCIVCHMEGQHTGTPGAVNWVKHYTDGLVSLRDVDNPATGWDIDNRAWGTTDYTNMDLFCLNCHDANGASGINVNATNNGLNLNNTRALTPFNTTQLVAGQWFTSSTNKAGTPKDRVNNLKDKFFVGAQPAGANYVGNPSQHAVIGKRYSTVWAAWQQQAWGSTYRLKKDGRLMNVARDTGILSCADCHVIDSGTSGNAHGGNNPYLMWTTEQVSMCWRCHNAKTYVAAMGNTTTDGSIIAHGDIDGGRGSSYTAYGLPANTASWPCLMCHASWVGYTTATRQATLGGIHGSWQTNASWVTTAGTPYRFTPGTYFKITPPGGVNGAWGSGGTPGCYFIGGSAAATSWTNCNSHNVQGSAAGAPARVYSRPVNY